MKILYHLFMLLILVAACTSFGISIRALFDAFSLAIIAASCSATGIISSGWRSFLGALRFVVYDKAGVQKDTAAILRAMAKTSLAMGILLAILGGITIMAGLPPDPQRLGRSIGFTLLSPFYGLYLAAFVFYPLSLRAKRGGPA